MDEQWIGTILRKLTFFFWPVRPHFWGSWCSNSIVILCPWVPTSELKSVLLKDFHQFNIAIWNGCTIEYAPAVSKTNFSAKHGDIFPSFPFFDVCENKKGGDANYLSEFISKAWNFPGNCALGGNQSFSLYGGTAATAAGAGCSGRNEKEKQKQGRIQNDADYMRKHKSSPQMATQSKSSYMGLLVVIMVKR